MLEAGTRLYICANCGSRYGFFRLYCKQCGCILPAALAGSGAATRLLDDRTARPVKVEWGRTHFHRFARLVLRDETTDEAIPISLDKAPVILGRGSLNDMSTSAFCALGS